MIIRCSIVSLHLLMFINEVSLLDTVVGVVGSSVVLPCSTKEPRLMTTGISVNWRQHDRVIVYAIINGQVLVEGQDSKYKNRVESFPEEYVRGNFSIKLNNLQNNDRGKYQCYIINQQESDVQIVELLIKVPLDSIVRYVGDSVVLPCSSELTAEDITVHWRHNNSLNVYDIVKGKVSVEQQDSAYYNRTESLPQEYKTGNYSLKLNNLQYNDSGNYTCYITKELVIYSMELHIKDQGAQSRPEKVVTLVALLSVFILLCI